MWCLCDETYGDLRGDLGEGLKYLVETKFEKQMSSLCAKYYKNDHNVDDIEAGTTHYKKVVKMGL